MLNLPIVKFEKSCNYLTEQLTLQNNNKQLILDIISNIGLILNDSEEKIEQYENILESANEFLKIISSNITSIEQLNLELKNITAELTKLLSEQKKASKTKEFYIAAFSNIKHNIIVYSKKFQETENKLTIDNNKFNEFINENNFKYNFVSIDDSTSTYTFTGFSVNDIEALSTNTDNENSKNNTTVEGALENNTTGEVILKTNEVNHTSKIDELTNEFKTLLINLSETNISDATESVVSLFKEMLPQQDSATFEDFLDFGKKPKDDTPIEDVLNFDENNSNLFDEELMFENFIIETQEKLITAEHNAITYTSEKELENIEKISAETLADDNIIEDEDISAESLVNDELLEAIIEDETVSDESLIDDKLLEEAIVEIEGIDDESLIDDELLKSAIETEKVTDESLTNNETFAKDESDISNFGIDIDSLFDEPTPEELESAALTIEEFIKKDNLKDKHMSKEDFEIKISNIENATEDNKTLVISEKLQKIYLPYKVSELVNYVESYPGSYKSLKDVVNQEFVLPFDYFKKHPSKARFTEAYNLLKNREGRNFMKSVSYAFRLLRKNNLNPAIIASCKTQHELDSYLYYLDSDNLNNFKFFDIIYEVNPI